MTAEFRADDNTAWTFLTLAGEMGCVCLRVGLPPVGNFRGDSARASNSR